MKVLVALFSLLAFGAADHCYSDVKAQCIGASDTLMLKSCNATYGGYGRHVNLAQELQAYAKLHIERSYEYLLSASYYNNYQTNRDGFSKLFRKLSDDTWGKAIELMKHVTLRGGEMDFSVRSSMERQHSSPSRNTVELHELESLAKALDIQKDMAERAFHIHREATKNGDHSHDPEVAQYLEEEFIEDQAKTVRDLAGHTADLKHFAASKGQDLSLSLYLFDEYLQKVV